MQTLIKKYLDRQISRRGFMHSMAALGFSAAAVDSMVRSVASAAEPPPHDGVEFVGTGAEVIIETLKAAGVEYLFNTTATGMAALFDALATRPEMNLIISLQEGQATSIAHGYELASGKTAALFIPGVAIPNAMNNLYNAWKDRSAIAVLSDSANSTMRGRNMFQQIDDWLEPMEQFTKWRWQVSQPKRVGELTRRALKVAATPPGGPVHVRFPLDILSAPDIKQRIYPQSRFSVPLNLQPKTDLIEQAAGYLIQAEHPLISVGSEVTRAGANDELIELAELLGIPVAQGFSVYGDFPFRHPLFAGFYGLGAPTGATGVDVFLNLGAPMPDPAIMTFPVPRRAKVIHARIEYEDIGNVHPTEVAIAAGLKETIVALSDTIKAKMPTRRLARIGSERMQTARAAAATAEEKRREQAKANWNASPLSWERLSFELEQSLEADAVIVSELDYRTPYEWLNFSQGKKRLIGQTTGFALGWGVGAALGAKIALPDRQVVSLLGDGAMLFGQLECLWTASRYEIPVIIVVFNNLSYDGERVRIYRNSPMARNQKTRHLWKDMSCYLGNPMVDFVSIARSFDIDGARVSEPDKLPEVLARASAVTREGRPYLIDAMIEQKGIGANDNWHPDISIARLRSKQV